MAHPSTLDAASDPTTLAAFYEGLANARILATEGRLDEARATLEALAAARVAAPFGHPETADLALELALPRLAERELQLAIRDARGTHREPAAHARLAEHYRDLAAPTRELRARDRLAARAPDAPDPDPARHEALRAPPLAPDEAEPPEPDPNDPDAHVPDPIPPAPEAPRPRVPAIPDPTPADLTRFQRLFAGRGDVHARQWFTEDGRHGYSPVERPLTHERLRDHLAGRVTVGVYQVREDQTVAFFALDLDAIKPALARARADREAATSLRRRLHGEGLRMRALAASFGLDLLLEDSGYKGRHLWGFLEQPLPVSLVRNFVRLLGRALAPDDPELAVECYPKQDRLRAGQIGNLIKLPLGVHLRSGRRALILDPDGRPAEDPWPLIRAAPLLDREALIDAMAELQARANAPDLADDPGLARLHDLADAPPLHPPAPPEPAFVLEDFERHPELSTILAGCGVLKRLVERGLERRRLTHEEQNVIRHTLGHRPAGIAAVNYIFQRCPEIPTENHVKSILSGYPVSCPKIRKKVPDITSRLACNCEFRSRPDHYPSPLLHLDETRARGTFPRPVTLSVSRPDATPASPAPARPAPAPSPRAASHEAAPPPRPRAPAPEPAPETAHASPPDAQALTAIAAIATSLRQTEAALVGALRALPGQRLSLPDGTWHLDPADPHARPVWTPATAPTKAP
jgi:hypothetical protein